MPAFACRPTASPRRGRRRRLAIIAAIAALVMPTQAANAGASLSTATPLLVVDGFHGSFAGNVYQPAPGDVVDGSLTRARGTETIGGDKAVLAGGDTGLDFQPSATPDGGLVVEAVARRTAAWVPATT